jgi:hypothetical protein
MTARTGNPVGRPGLGERRVVIATAAAVVPGALDDLAAAAGTDRSTVLADAAAALVGLPDAARRLRFEVQHRALTGAAYPERPFTTATHPVVTRLPVSILPEFDRLAHRLSQSGRGARACHLGDLAAALAGCPELSRRPEVSRQLKLELLDTNSDRGLLLAI